MGHLQTVPAKGIEIGCYEGRSTCFFVQNILKHTDSTLTCIDPFVIAGTRDRFMHNVDALGCYNKIRLIERDSMTIFLDPNSYDFAYIDGLHTAKAALFDAVLCWKALKRGGIMIFDDYQWCINEKMRVDCPKMGIDAFLNVCEREMEILSIGYQVVVKKR